MARKRKEFPLLEKVTITDVAAEGKAIAKVNDLVIFVPYVVPGDVVDLQIKRKKNKYAESWEQVDDTTYTYKIRQGVKFSDGNEMTMYDVLYSLNRVTEDLKLR